MERLVTIRVGRCSDICPHHSRLYWSYCKAAQREINGFDLTEPSSFKAVPFPTWCPLPDAPEAKEEGKDE